MMRANPKLTSEQIALEAWARWRLNGNCYPGISIPEYYEAAQFHSRLPRGVEIGWLAHTIAEVMARLERQECAKEMAAVRAWYLRKSYETSDRLAQQLGFAPASFRRWKREGERMIKSALVGAGLYDAI